MNQQEIFFFSQFRTNLTVKSERGGQWSSKVRATIARITEGSTNLSKKQEIYQRAKDISRLLFEPKMSLSKELITLANVWINQRGKWPLGEMGKIPDAADRDLESMSSRHFDNLRDFAEAIH